MSKEIVELNNDGILENICTKLKPISKLKFKHVESSTNPMFSPKLISQKKDVKKSHSPFLEVEYKGKKIYI